MYAVLRNEVTKNGSEHLGLPTFANVTEGMKVTGAETPALYVPPPFAAGAILEAVEAEIPPVVCITEGIPALDMIKVKAIVRSQFQTRLIGPNCLEIIKPGTEDGCKIGIRLGNSENKFDKSTTKPEIISE